MQKLDFHDGLLGGHLGYPIWTILAIFDLQVTAMLPTKFQVYWPFGSSEVKNRFSRCHHHGGYLGFQIRTLFLSTSYSDDSSQVSGQLVFCFRSLFVYVEVLRPSQPNGSCRARSVYLTTRLLGRLSPLSGLPVLCTFFRQKLTTALLESAEGREWP